MTRAPRVLLMAVALTSFGGIWAAPAPGACAPAEVQAPERARVGEEITVTGRYWFEDCDDTGGRGGCAGEPESEPQSPYEEVDFYLLGPVTIEVERDFRTEGWSDLIEHEIKIATVDADDKGRIAFTFEIPDVPPATYYLRSCCGETHSILVLRRK